MFLMLFQMKKNLILIVFLCFNLIYGQRIVKGTPKLITEELSFYLLDTELGLSSNYINSIVQDSLGFVWIGTPEGLNRYDGSKFKVYKKDNVQGNQSLSNEFIRQLTLINKGKLVISTDEGINIYNPRKETFNVLNEKSGLIGNNISCFEFGAENELILGIYDRGIQIIDKNKKSTVYKNNPNTIASLSSNEIIGMAKQGDSLLWVGTKKSGLNKINYKTKKVTRVSFSKNKKEKALQVNAVYTGKEGELWVGSNEGIHVITVKGDTLHLKKSTNGSGLSDDNVLCFEEDNHGNIWIGTRNGGLNIINKSDFLKKKSDLLVKWYLPKDDGSSIFNRTVSALKKDRDGNIWIGTSTGLNFVNPNGEPIKLLRKNNSRKESLGHDRIGALAESNEGNIWIGTDGAGLDLFNPTSGNFKHYKHDPSNANSLSNDYIISLHEDQKKRLWIGTYQGGLNKMNSKTGHFTHYLQGSVDQGSDVRVIFEDSKNQIWVGTNRGGLYKYKEATDQFEFISSLGKIDIRDISEDQNGFLWLASYGNGIFRLSPSKGSHVLYNSSNTAGFTSDNTLSILALPDGDVLVGTENEGLIRLNSTNGSALSFYQKNGLSNNTVSNIVMENENSIWLGTYKGISNYNISTNKLYNLNNYTNIQQGFFRSGLITKSVTIYLGGDSGLNIFKTKNLQRKKENHSIVFEKLNVSDKQAKISENNKKGVLDESILYANHFLLDHNETFFSIDYVAIKYPFAKNVTYSYQVEGYNDNWINTNKIGKVNLINMPHGNYTLNVKAKFGLEDEIIKKIHITINPPLWRTPLAYICYLVLLVAMLYGFMRYYSEHVKLINSLLFEKKQRQLEHNFNEERIRFFTSFSHELKTPLTLILAPLEDLISEIKTGKHKKSLSLIQENAKQLLQTINKLLEFRKSNLGLSKLRIEEHNLTFLLEQWVHNYYPLAKNRDIALSYDFPEENLLVWFDLEKMHIIFNNLLSNAFKYTQDKGEIYVTLTFDGDYFEIKVKDTGYGIAPNELDHIFERYYQSKSVKSKNSSGIGLALSKNFVELHMGTIHIESELKKGSVFSVNIPRDKTLFVNADFDVKSEANPEKDMIANEWVAMPELQTVKQNQPNINVNESKELLLIVDDTPEILKYLDRLLEGTYDLIYANNGEEGVEKALRYIPDLIISDVMMPKMNGIELCNVLKETTETTHIPIILLTAKDNLESIQEGYTFGADDYIVKPFSSKILQTRIRNLLDTRKQLRRYFLNKEDVETNNLNKETNTLLDQEKEFLSKLDKIILEHLNEESLDVWIVAKNIGMSRTSLYRKIKAITGLNINQYIRRIKINKASQLLRSGNYTVAQASYEVGFNNVKYFRKLFKEQLDYLPSELTKNK